VVTNLYIGTDIVEVHRIKSSIAKSKSKFLNRIFSIQEQQYCESKSNPEIHYAGRFAAKEAIVKAIKSSGFSNPISFSSIEILSSNTGQPIVNLRFNIDGDCKVSISHIDTHAVASAIFSS
tara:strand:+ start:2449 stop:2811 length:363 start_codon:yes stop_codon:yes gene_type:complete